MVAAMMAIFVFCLLAAATIIAVLVAGPLGLVVMAAATIPLLLVAAALSLLCAAIAVFFRALGLLFSHH